MCNEKNKDQIFAANSSYSLYMYLLRFTHKINNTLFVLGPALHDVKLPRQIHVPAITPENKTTIESELSEKLRLELAGTRVPLYGNLTFEPTAELAKHYPLHVLSDGLSDGNRFAEYLKNPTYPAFYTTLENGVSSNDSRVEYLDLKALWHSKGVDEQNKIAGIFGISDKDLTAFKTRSTVLVTQPLSEDGIISEEEKISLYTRIIFNRDDLNDMIIKPHPREKTDYNWWFGASKIPVPSRLVPAELFAAITPIKRVVTFYSTAAFNMGVTPENIDIYAADFKHLHMSRPGEKMGNVPYVDIEEKYRSNNKFNWKKIPDVDGRFYRLPLAIVTEHPSVQNLRAYVLGQTRQNG